MFEEGKQKETFNPLHSVNFIHQIRYNNFAGKLKTLHLIR